MGDRGKMGKRTGGRGKGEGEGRKGGKREREKGVPFFINEERGTK